MKRILGGFGLLAGATYPFRALIVIKRTPRLRKYIIVPILVNFLLAIGIYGGTLFFGWQIVNDLTLQLSNWVDSLIANLPAWLGAIEYLIFALAWLVRLLLILGLFIVTGFLLAQFGVLLGSPWYGQLSEQLEKIRTDNVEIVEVGIVGDIWRAILFEVKKLALAIAMGIPLLLLNLFPGIGTAAATVEGIIIAATLVCLDFLDAPMERRRWSFRRKLKTVITHLPATASFSLVCLVLASIPLINLLTIPLCVASGTLFFCDRIAWVKPNSILPKQ